MKKLYDWFRYDFLPGTKTLYWNTRYFFKNIWIFRRELSRFRPFDYDFNIEMLSRSLEETANFLDSDDAVVIGADETAEEIRVFLDCISHARNPYDLATTRLGYDHEATSLNIWLGEMQEKGDEKPWKSSVAPQPSEKEMEYHRECSRIENEMWDKAWDLFSKRARYWWD